MRKNSVLTTRIHFGLVAIAATVALTSGCSSGVKPMPASSCQSSVTQSSEYRIGPGDSLQIVVWRNAELSATVPVRPDGRISTPLIDDMQASGKTPSALAKDMETVLSEYLRTPEVSVIVSSQGAANQIQVVGEVVNPQAISFRDGIRVLDAIVAAGGLSEFAAGNRTNLVRETVDGQIKCQIKVKDLMSGDLSQNVDLSPGDMLVVPASRF